MLRGIYKAILDGACTGENTTKSIYRTIGRVNLIDALNGNTEPAVDIITGKQPLVQPNEKITVDATLVGKAVDFLETVAGVEVPWTTIPGDYLSNPQNPIVNAKPAASTQGGKLFQDITGALGSMVGIQRRPSSIHKAIRYVY